MKKFLFLLPIALLFAELSFAQINAPRGSKRQIINQDYAIEIESLKAYYLKLAGDNPTLDVNANPTKAELWTAITALVYAPLDPEHHAIGTGTVASGENSHAQGLESIASNANSHAEGDSARATAAQSHAEGLKTLASGVNSHAQNEYTTASGTGAHASGRYTVAEGSYSFAGGQYNRATGSSSYAGGMGSSTSDRSDATGRSSFVHQQVLGGSGVKVADGDYSAILGGRNNSTDYSAARSVVLGGDGQNATLPDAVYMHQLKLKALPGAPSGLGAADAGLIVFDDVIKVFRGWNGTAWVNFH